MLLLPLCAPVELTYNYGVESYDIGEGFGHFGVALPDVAAAAEKIKAGGGAVRDTELGLSRWLCW